jgi:hypothetical protein
VPSMHYRRLFVEQPAKKPAASAASSAAVPAARRASP